MRMTNRFHLAGTSRHFRAFSDGPTIDGRQVQYSLTERDGHRLYDESFRHIRTVSMPGSDPHDFLITEDDTLLFMGYKSATRDASHITDPKTQLPLSMNQRVSDVIIVERTLSGATLFEWNSWDHLNIPDCIPGGFYRERYVRDQGGPIRYSRAWSNTICPPAPRLEVNPSGEAVFQMNMSGDGYPVSSYRVYRMPETEFKIPGNLP